MCGHEYRQWDDAHVQELFGVLEQEMARRGIGRSERDGAILLGFAEWLEEYGLINANDTDPKRLISEYRDGENV